jgi:hypothetical protein
MAVAALVPRGEKEKKKKKKKKKKKGNLSLPQSATQPGSGGVPQRGERCGGGRHTP